MLAICPFSIRSTTRLVRKNLRPTLSRVFGSSRFDCFEQRNGDSVTEATFSVSKYDTVCVFPTRKNQADRNGLYALSNLDQTLTFPVEMLFEFQTHSSINVGRILKRSLSKVLEVYYPLAGRLKVGSDGKMVVDCDVEEGGVLFAEAFSDKAMTVAVGDITVIDQKLVRKLVYSNHKPYETILDVPPLAIQVTRFRCGGMILGLRFNHVLLDGIGLTDFMNSWSEIARDVPLSIEPHLDRSILSPRKPPYIHFPKLEIPLIRPNPLILTKSFRFTPTMLSRLRELAMRKTVNKNKPAPTNFELISALVWICWTNVKKVGPKETTRILVAVDGRRKLHPPMPKGYFGNGIVLSCAQARAHEITSLPLSHAVGIVHDAIKVVTDDFIRSTIDFQEITRKPLEMDNAVWITKWTRLPFYEIDFGWGVASQVVSGSIFKNLVIIQGKEKDNIVISLNLPVDAMEAFQEELNASQLKL